MNPEIYITYCIFDDEDAFLYRDIRFETDDRAVARQWMHRGDYLIKVCASCEISSGGAMLFGYGDTAAEARKELKSQLKEYGL